MHCSGIDLHFSIPSLAAANNRNTFVIAEHFAPSLPLAPLARRPAFAFASTFRVRRSSFLTMDARAVPTTALIEARLSSRFRAEQLPRETCELWSASLVISNSTFLLALFVFG